MPRPLLGGCYRVCSSLRIRLDSAPAKTQSDALEVGARRDSRMERAGFMAMGKCTHVEWTATLEHLHSHLPHVFAPTRIHAHAALS